MKERLVGETELQFHKRRVSELEGPRKSGERSGIRLTGRGDGVTTRILDALTGEDLGVRYGIREVQLKVSGSDGLGSALVLELGCPVVAELTGCWPQGS